MNLSQDICLFLFSAITHERWEGITALYNVLVKATTSASNVWRFFVFKKIMLFENCG